MWNTDDDKEPDAVAPHREITYTYTYQNIDDSIDTISDILKFGDSEGKQEINIYSDSDSDKIKDSASVTEISDTEDCQQTQQTDETTMNREATVIKRQLSVRMPSKSSQKTFSKERSSNETSFIAIDTQVETDSEGYVYESTYEDEGLVRGHETASDDNDQGSRSSDAMFNGTNNIRNKNNGNSNSSSSRVTASTTKKTHKVWSNITPRFPDEVHIIRPYAKRNVESLICFDFDDTLMPSSSLQKCGYNLNTDADGTVVAQSLLREHVKAVRKTLLLALECAPVVLVTNAQTGWIQQSCAKFMPSLEPLLDRMHIISARSEYEDKYPDSPLTWKMLAFEYLCATQFHTNASHMKQLVQIGDSRIERDAMFEATRCSKHIIVPKSVKLTEFPTIDQLIQQHVLIQTTFIKMFTQNEVLDVQMSVIPGMPMFPQ